MDANNVMKLLAGYKHLINFEEAMEKSNYKFVDQYVKWQKKRNKEWVNDCVAFLSDAIDVHKNYLRHKEKRI